MAHGIVTNIYRNSEHRRPIIDSAIEFARKIRLYKVIDYTEFSTIGNKEANMRMESVEGAFPIVKFLEWVSDYRGSDREEHTIWTSKNDRKIIDVK